MKKIICTLMLVAVFSAGTFAMDITPYAGIDFGLSAYQSWIAPNGGVELTFKKWLGIGAEAQALFGTTYGDSWLNGYLYGRLWIFTLGAGASIRLSDSRLPADSEFDTMATPSDPVNFALMTGMDIPLFTTGPVNWGLVTSVDAVFTDTPIMFIEDEELNFFELLVVNFFAAIFQGGFGSLINSVKATVGVQASF